MRMRAPSERYSGIRKKNAPAATQGSHSVQRILGSALYPLIAVLPPCKGGKRAYGERGGWFLCFSSVHRLSAPPFIDDAADSPVFPLPTESQGSFARLAP